MAAWPAKDCGRNDRIDKAYETRTIRYNDPPRNPMSKRMSEFANSLKHLGQIQVSEWDFMALLNTDIRELEIARSLRRLGGVQVMEWDFRTVLPAVKKIAYQEVDVYKMLRRTAQYKVMEWDFRNPLSTGRKPRQVAAPLAKCPSPDAMRAISERLAGFLQYVVANLIDEPKQVRIKVTPMGPSGLRCKVVLVKRDVAILIGREGFTASAIRNILKAVAGSHGVQALLQIQSQEEEMALGGKERARELAPPVGGPPP